MFNHKLRPVDKHMLHDLISVARGHTSCNFYIQGGTIINVYTGELLTANVAVKGKYIAYVGDSDQMVGDSSRIIDAAGLYLCPGYIEPHAHPFQTYNPVTLVEKVAALGTTTLICDNLFFFMSMDEKALLKLWQKLANLPIKLLWSVRLDPQTYSSERTARFTPQRIQYLLDTPLARQVGELTDWPSLLSGDEQMLDNIITAGEMGKRIEGHAPGASEQTLNFLAAGGISACHESITGEEAMQRLRLGMYATIRHSSLRPDLPVIMPQLLHAGIDLRRIMFTTDGITPPSMRHGFTDHIIKLAIESGVPAMEAYRMATLNPAVYYGLDSQLGGIAPGRLADILLLEDLRNPKPVTVFADGNLVAKQGVSPVFTKPDWDHYLAKPFDTAAPSIAPGDLIPPVGEGDFPVMQLVNPVITRRRNTRLAANNGKVDISAEQNLIYATLLGKEGVWACNGVLGGFASNLAGMACSNTITGDVLVLGREPNEMLLAIRRMFELGGGIVVCEDNQIIYELPLPLGGIMSDQHLDELIGKCYDLYELLARRGHTHYDLLYTILFLSATHLPEVRLSPAGILSVKDKQILVPSRII